MIWDRDNTPKLHPSTREALLAARSFAQKAGFPSTAVTTEIVGAMILEKDQALQDICSDMGVSAHDLVTLGPHANNHRTHITTEEMLKMLKVPKGSEKVGLLPRSVFLQLLRSDDSGIRGIFEFKMALSHRDNLHHTADEIIALLSQQEIQDEITKRSWSGWFKNLPRIRIPQLFNIPGEFKQAA